MIQLETLCHALVKIKFKKILDSFSEYNAHLKDVEHKFQQWLSVHIIII